MEFLCIKCELNLNKRMEDDYVYAPESVLARVISSEVSKKCCNRFRNARTIFPTNQKRGTCHVHQVGLFDFECKSRQIKKPAFLTISEKFDALLAV